MLPHYCTASRDIWRSVTYLICWEIVKCYLPHRVMRQFGLHQPIPDQRLIGNQAALHLTDRRGRANTDWELTHRQYIDIWGARTDTVEVGLTCIDTTHASGDYMQWYRARTVMYISNPSQRPTFAEGYLGDGARADYLMDSMARLYYMSLDNMPEDDTPDSSTWAQISHFTSQSLHAVGKSTRLDLRPPPVPVYVRHPHQAHDPHRVERAPRRGGQHGGGRGRRRVPSPRPHVDAESPHVNIPFEGDTSHVLSPMRTPVGPSSFGQSSTAPDPEHTGPTVSDEEHEHEQSIPSQAEIAHHTQQQDTPLFYVRRSKRVPKPRDCGIGGRFGHHGH
ncbi:hypothetical protein ACH5RR_026110 [Cinchona calisaya]|uniref:Aminotransferase-like plant mobile domain-containing protein n=1 Tax=Cinchona calisaya TaxID=153742 RepID=A0ABD2Z6K9_9GENT